MNKFTPGPWRVEDYENKGNEIHRFEICSLDHDVCIADVSVDSDRKYDSEAEANANLLAASPDLYSAAQQAIIVLTDVLAAPTGFDDDIKKALTELVEAIAKANGEK